MNQQVNDNTELQLTLQVAEINAILASLQELPAKVANPLTQKIMGQSSKQIDELNGAGQNLQVEVQDGAQTQESFA